LAGRAIARYLAASARILAGRAGRVLAGERGCALAGRPGWALADGPGTLSAGLCCALADGARLAGDWPDWAAGGRDDPQPAASTTPSSKADTPQRQPDDSIAIT
jgi:hypothetical protein